MQRVHVCICACACLPARVCLCVRREGEGGRVAERLAESGDGGGGSESLIG